MPGDPFTPINGDGPSPSEPISTPQNTSEAPASDVEPAAGEAVQPSEGTTGASYSPPSGGNIFSPKLDDGFQVPSSLSGAFGRSLNDDGSGGQPFDGELEEAYAEVSQDGMGPSMTGKLRQMPGDVGANTPQIPPARPDTFCCMVGPCRHYIELVLGLEKDDPADPFDRPDLWRVCMKMHDREGEISLKDANVPLCSGYAPPLTSLAGWLKHSEVRLRLDRIGRRRPRRDDVVLARVQQTLVELRGVEEGITRAWQALVGRKEGTGR
jgi:hypothetical protein